MKIEELKTKVKEEIEKLNPTGRRSVRVLDPQYETNEIENAYKKALRLTKTKGFLQCAVLGASCGGSVANAYKWAAGTDGLLVEFIVTQNGSIGDVIIRSEIASANKCTSLTVARHLGADDRLIAKLDDRYSKKTFDDLMYKSPAVFW